ncbi:hypothetical protein LUZ60_006686 [Juncus effusus]|nr:hypothetical protein LUZ60_006686 [Juncus effusus]
MEWSAQTKPFFLTLSLFFDCLFIPPPFTALLSSINPYINLNSRTNIPKTKLEMDYDMTDAAAITDSQLWQTFSIFDKNLDGSISRVELESVLQTLGQNPTKAELDKMIEEVDLDGNGAIEFDEFKRVIMEYDVVDEDMRSTFDVFDKDGNGFISLDELKNIVMMSLGKELTNAELAKMISEADTDGDGQVNYDEFVSVMMTAT